MKKLPLVGALLLFCGGAAASPDYPQTIEADLGISHLPVAGAGCLLCHKDDNGGLNTIDTRFGKTMQRLGVVEESPGSLTAALHADEQQGIDSDGDGVADIDELRAGTDPSVQQLTGDASADLPPEPPNLETGCAIHRGHSGTKAWLIVAVFAALAHRRAARKVGARRTRF